MNNEPPKKVTKRERGGGNNHNKRHALLWFSHLDLLTVHVQLNFFCCYQNCMAVITSFKTDVCIISDILVIFCQPFFLFCL